MGGVRNGVQAVRELFESGTAVGLTDGELLERFMRRRDEGAFTALVERHGPMVLRACRDLLGDHHQALDAFQATFLVLAGKGGTLRERGSLAPWLHRVACRASTRAVRASARRRAAERRAVERAPAEAPGATPPAERDELTAIVRQEVDRLPDRYRDAVILCDLEGLTCEQAAQRLGRPAGTVASRLSRGRDRLRERLRRRGLAPGAGLLVGPGLALPAGLAESTATAAVQFLASSAAPSGVAAFLAMGVLQAMTRNAWWKAAALLLTLAASTTGVVAVAARGGGGASASASVAPDDPDPVPPVQASPEARTVEVRPRRLPAVVQGMGARMLERARRGVVVSSPTRDDLPVRSFVPMNTRVVKGQVICELDVTETTRELAERQAELDQAMKELGAAKQVREAARLGVVEYEEVIRPTERAVAERKLKESEIVFREAQARVRRTQEARTRFNNLMEKQGGVTTPADVLADLEIQDRLGAAEAAVESTSAAREEASFMLAALLRRKPPKALAVLQASVEEAAAAESAKATQVERATERVDALRRRTDEAKILAPSDGGVASIFFEKAAFPAMSPDTGYIAKGLAPLYHIVGPDGGLRVEAQVPEGGAGRIAVGMPAVVNVSRKLAPPAESSGPVSWSLAGTVAALSPVADGLASPDGPPTYRVEVEIEHSDPELIALVDEGRELRVQVEIDAAREVPCVPLKAVVRYDDRDHVAIERADGQVDWRVVELGFIGGGDDAEGEQVQVLDGLKPDDRVVADPVPLLTDDQRRKVDAASPRPDPAAVAVRKRAEAAQAVFRKLGAPRVENRPPSDQAERARQDADLKARGLTDAEIRLYREFPPGAYGAQ